MIVVADTGPIIALAKLDRVDLLGVFGADILVPPRVRRELLSKPEQRRRKSSGSWNSGSRSAKSPRSMHERKRPSMGLIPESEMPWA